MRIRLSDEDRARLGIESEWIEFDLDQLMSDEAEQMEAAGYFLDDFLTELRPATDGQRRPVRALRTAVWMAARRSGCTVPWAEFNYSLVGTQFEAPTAPEPTPARKPRARKQARGAAR